MRDWSDATGLMRIVTTATAPIPSLQPRDAAWNPALTPAIVAAPASAPALTALAADGALVITTGQQPGLFTGPLYTVHKALAAASLARRLSSAWQRPVVPMLWVAGDDHDWTEATGAAWLDAGGLLRQWHLPARPFGAPQLSMSREVVPPEMESGLQELETTLPAGPHRDSTMAWLRRHYHRRATMQSAAAGALAELLAPAGVLVFDPTHQAAKQAQAPYLAAALEQAESLDRLLSSLPPLERGVAVGDGMTLVFLETTAGRERLVVEDGAFRARRSGESFSLADLQRMLQQSPERFSANALLRPVIESAILPTVTYVGGPGELRYLNQQAAALYQPLGVWRQPPIARWSGSVVEAWADRLLDRLGISLDQLLSDDDGALGKELLRRDLPQEVVEILLTLRRDVAMADETLRASGRALDPVLDRAVEGRSRKLTMVLDDMQQLFERHLRRRDDIAWSQYRRLRTGLRPQDAPQERVFTAASFLARHGTSWLDAVTAATDQWASA